MEILDRAKSFLSDVVEGKLAAEDAKRSALGGNVAGNSDAGVGAGIDIIEYDPETHEYTFKEEMLYYYDKELFEKVSRLLK